MPPEPEPLVWTVPQAARLLQVSDRYVYMLIEAGRLPCLRLGRKVLIPRKALTRVVDETSTQVPAAEA